MVKNRWTEITLADFVAYVKLHEIVDPNVVAIDLPGPDGYGAQFDDGSVIVFQSDWSGPYSEYTPDIVGNPPRIWRKS